MEKNEEPLAEEREELKYILPEAKSIKIYRGWEFMSSVLVSGHSGACPSKRRRL